MQLGIIGLPKVGKTTLFNTLTSAHQATGKFATAQKANVGVAPVPDPRLEQLRELYKPRRFVPATAEYVDLPGFRRSADSDAFDPSQLRNVDALIHVVRAFEDPEILHPDGAVDPARDVATLELELILADHQLVDRRLARLVQAKKRGLSDDEKREQALLESVILPALENETALRLLALSPGDELRLRGFQLLSAKPMLVVLNVGEEVYGSKSAGDFGIETGEHVECLVVSAPIEEEISRLEADEQVEFLADLGQAEPSLVRLVRASYELLGLISFFTVGDDEVRAWTLRSGTTAREAAGVIHSDLERGFIRAEVVRWDELLSDGSLAASRDRGALRLEGKDYVVQDGDVMHIRFNV